MPEISRFFGIVVYVYFDDHAPPHIHVRHAGESAQVRIDPAGVLEGELSPRARRRVLRWVTLHRDELLANWYLAQAGKTPFPVAPLGE